MESSSNNVTKLPGVGEPPNYGICPLMSHTTIVQMRGPVLHGSNTDAAQVVVMEAKCLGPRCQLWNRESGMCSLRIADILEKVIGLKK